MGAREAEEVAVAELAAVLAELGFEVEASAGSDGADLILPRPGDARCDVELTAEFGLASPAAARSDG